MKAFLVILFLHQGEIFTLDGWLPREQPNMAFCKARAAAIEAYIPHDPTLPKTAFIGCIEADSARAAIIEAATKSGAAI